MQRLKVLCEGNSELTIGVKKQNHPKSPGKTEVQIEMYLRQFILLERSTPLDQMPWFLRPSLER